VDLANGPRELNFLLAAKGIQALDKVGLLNAHLT
jgi:hypothetical protein